MTDPKQRLEELQANLDQRTIARARAEANVATAEATQAQLRADMLKAVKVDDPAKARELIDKINTKMDALFKEAEALIGEL